MFFKKKRIKTAFFIFLFSFFIAIIIYSFSIPDITFYQKIAKHTGLSQYHIESNKFLKVITSLKKRSQIIGILTFFFSIIISIIYYFFPIENILREIIKPLKNTIHIKELIKELVIPLQKEILLIPLFVLYITIRVFFMFFRPLTIDESFTFYGYATKSIFYALTSLSAANNHLLNTFFIHWLYLLFGNSIISIRLMSLIVSSILFFLSFSITFNITKNRMASLLTASFITVSPIIINFSTLGRGYIYIILFTILSLYYLIKINDDYTKYSLPFAISSSLGFYAMPTFLYVFISGILFYITYYRNKKIIYGTIYTIIITGILYLPPVLISGLSMFTESMPHPPIKTIYDVIQHITKIFNLISMNVHLTPIVLLAFIFIGIKIKKARSFLFYMLCIVFVFFLISLIILKTIPPYRVILSIIVPIMIIYLSITIVSIIQKHLPIQYSVIAFILIIGTLHFTNNYEIIMNRYCYYPQYPVVKMGLSLAHKEKVKIAMSSYEILKFYSTHIYNDTTNICAKNDSLNKGDYFMILFTKYHDNRALQKLQQDTMLFSQMFKDFPLIKKQKILYDTIYGEYNTYLFKVKKIIPKHSSTSQ